MTMTRRLYSIDHMIRQVGPVYKVYLRDGTVLGPFKTLGAARQKLALTLYSAYENVLNLGHPKR